MSTVRTLATRRKTCRRFRADTPPREVLERALEAARQAPSGSNRQPWRFLIMTEREDKRKVREAAEEGEKAFYDSLSEERMKWYAEKGLSWRKPVLEEAPTLLVVLADSTAPNYMRSTWLMIGWLLLAIEEEELATFTYTPSNPDLLKKMLSVPDPYVVESILPLGYSADTKQKEQRIPLVELIQRTSPSRR